MSARYLSAEVDVAAVRSLVGEVIYPSVSLPGQVFQPPYRSFAFFDYSHLQDPECWKSLLGAAGADCVRVIYLDPDFAAFRDAADHPYGLIEIDQSSTLDEIRTVVTESPTENFGEAFLYLSPKCLFIPDSKQWILWAHREVDLAIAAFSNAGDRQEFIRATSNWKLLDSVADAIHFLTAGGGKLSKQFFCDPMIENYSDKSA
jgi:hypothetical protein